MASSAILYKGKDGKPLKFCSRYYDHLAGGLNVFSQHLDNFKGYFVSHEFNDFYVLGNSAFTEGLVAPWYNLLQANAVSSWSVTEPFSNKCFVFIWEENT